MVFCQNDANGIANSEDPDQTAPIWVCTVCPDQSVRELRVITVRFFYSPMLGKEVLQMMH